MRQFGHASRHLRRLLWQSCAGLSSWRRFHGLFWRVSSGFPKTKYSRLAIGCPHPQAAESRTQRASVDRQSHSLTDCVDAAGDVTVTGIVYVPGGRASAAARRRTSAARAATGADATGDCRRNCQHRQQKHLAVSANANGSRNNPQQAADACQNSRASGSARQKPGFSAPGLPKSGLSRRAVVRCRWRFRPERCPARPH